VKSVDKIFSEIRYLYKKILHKSSECLNVNMQKYGSNYGGWVVATDYLNKDFVIYSFGVGEDVSFYLDIISKYGLTVHAFDPTPRSIDWVKKQNWTRSLLYMDML
jgi:hypothetical protein